ncbi:hypothetical protein F4821DRAFT_46905 [Hypoxylon rubiginosum]|uniref:Uncharacterized protein n=1 Tax=Hypoxylon rubiginosum TaxID=110542 RepID=A0ACC0DBJ3_9PEZI|nr:hypothetical protein F4821DRAFT_46905 [Hypoxylon rubiginosum]
MDFSDTPGYHGHTEIGLNGALIGISTIVCSLRVFVRLFITKSLGLDDVLAAIAYLALTALSVMDIIAVQFGSGTHIAFVPEDVISKYFELFSIESILYFWVIAMVRYSILAFIPRIAQDKTISRISWAVAVLIIAQTIVATVYRLTECEPFLDNFKSPTTPGSHCVGLARHTNMMIGHGIVGIVLDLILLVLPIYVICNKMMWSRRTLQIVLVLSIGIFAVATAIIRVCLFATINLKTDVTWKMPFLSIWTNLEAHVGLWCCCFPALQPLLRTFMPANQPRVVSAAYNNSPHARYISGTQDRSNTRKEYELNANRPYEMLNGSQRTIVLPDKVKEDTIRRDRDEPAV